MNSKQAYIFSPPGERGLEVRGDGPGPVVPLDLHDGRRGRHRGHHPPGAQPIRRPKSNRQRTLGHRSTGKILFHIQPDLTPALVSCFRMAIDRTLTRSGLEELEPHADMWGEK